MHLDENQYLGKIVWGRSVSNRTESTFWVFYAVPSIFTPVLMLVDLCIQALMNRPKNSHAVNYDLKATNGPCGGSS